MDVKIGLSTVAEDASEAKRREAHQKDLDTTTHSLALRICGMRVFDGENYECRDKAWGKALDAASFEAGVRYFFEPHGEQALSVRRRGVVTQCIAQIEALRRFMAQQRTYRFYASSLLLVYEGVADESAGDGDGDARAVVRMIDMAHVFLHRDDAIGDNGYVLGLENLLRVLRVLLARG